MDRIRYMWIWTARDSRDGMGIGLYKIDGIGIFGYGIIRGRGDITLNEDLLFHAFVLDFFLVCFLFCPGLSARSARSSLFWFGL